MCVCRCCGKVRSSGCEMWAIIANVAAMSNILDELADEAFVGGGGTVHAQARAVVRGRPAGADQWEGG